MISCYKTSNKLGKTRVDGIRTDEVFVITLGKLCVISTQGLIRTAPAGNSTPMSLRTVNTVRHRPAPAESPAKTILDGGMGE
jgi:hypothetical protein